MRKPRGIRTGSAEASSVSAVQNARPHEDVEALGSEDAEAMWASTGITKLVMTSASSADRHESRDIDAEALRHQSPLRPSTPSDSNVPREGSDNETEVPRTPSATRLLRGRRRRSSTLPREGAAVEPSLLDTSHAVPTSEALGNELGTHRVPSNGFPCPHNTRKPTYGWSVGCTTRSASPLSAHFRGRHQRIRLFTLLPSTSVPVRRPDFRRDREAGSIVNLPYRSNSPSSRSQIRMQCAEAAALGMQSCP